MKTIESYEEIHSTSRNNISVIKTAGPSAANL